MDFFFKVAFLQDLELCRYAEKNPFSVLTSEPSTSNLSEKFLGKIYKLHKKVEMSKNGIFLIPLFFSNN